MADILRSRMKQASPPHPQSSTTSNSAPPPPRSPSTWSTDAPFPTRIPDEPYPNVSAEAIPKRFPKGVVLGKDGKPCRSCSSFASWAAMNKHPANASTSTSISPPTPSLSSSSSTSNPDSNPNPTTTSTSTSTLYPPPVPLDIPPNCPPDTLLLGRSTWTLLHSLPLNLPDRPPPPTPSEPLPLPVQKDTVAFLRLFGRLYPCAPCAQDFESWMAEPGNEVETAVQKGRQGLGRWMCEGHNVVNRKLGKAVFDCRRWEERWGDGPEDDSCG